MRGEGIEEEMMAESFQREERTFNEWIVPGEILVVPDELTLKGGRSDDKADSGQEQTAKPIFLDRREATKPQKQTCTVRPTSHCRSYPCRSSCGVWD